MRGLSEVQIEIWESGDAIDVIHRLKFTLQRDGVVVGYCDMQYSNLGIKRRDLSTFPSTNSKSTTSHSNSGMRRRDVSTVLPTHSLRCIQSTDKARDH